MIKNSLFFFSCSVLLLLSSRASGQYFQYQSQLEPVNQTGFYRIVLNAEIAAASQLHFNDLRISSGGREFVPYILSAAAAVSSASIFTEYPILKKEKDTAGNSIITIENISAKGIDNIWFFIKNTTAIRKASISGSNDRNDWFVIKEDIFLEPYLNPETEEYQPVINFPLSNYKYLRFVIDNAHRDPLNIVKAGIYNNTIVPGAGYAVNPTTRFTKSDSSDKRTYIFITQDKPYPVENIRLSVYAPKFYEREAQLYLLNDSSLQVEDQLASFTISSRAAMLNADTMLMDLSIPQTIKAKHLLLIINNGDNPALQVSGARLRHHDANIYTYLEKGKQYSLLFGNQEAKQPVYDLELFKDSIPAHAPELKYGELSLLNDGPGLAEPAQKNKFLLWSVIILAIGIVGFFTARLMKDMKAKDAV